MLSKQRVGILFGICAGAIWAIEVVLGKFLLKSHSFIQLTATEAFFASLTTLSYSLLRNSFKNLTISKSLIANLLIIGVIGTTIAPALYFLGLTKTYTVNVSLIAHLQPLFVSILSYYFLNERLFRKDVFAGFLIILSAIFITSRTLENLLSLKIGNLGDLTVLFATLCWAVTAIPGKKLSENVSSFVIVSSRFLIASTIFLPILLILNQLIIDSFYQILLGVLVGFGYVFYYEGLKRIKASYVALTELSSPLFATILSWLFLGERVTILQIIACILLVTGLFILSKRQSPNKVFDLKS
ncbi:MAG: DMT family transporter [Promethearchaeota archaeon]